VKVWAVANQKGGVGKTTTAVTLGGLLAQRGRSTLLVDLDPHGSMTSYFGYDPDEVEDGIYLLFEGGGTAARDMPVPVLRQTRFDHLMLLPATTALATLDKQLGARDGMGLILARYLRQLGARFEHVLIDCPPVLGVLLVNALAACGHLVIPVQTEFLALKGLERMMHTLAMVLRARKIDIPYTIVPALFDRRTRASIDSLRQLQQTYPDHLWPGAIPVDTLFREASRMGIPLPQLAPQARGTLAYAGLLDHLLGGVASTPVAAAGGSNQETPIDPTPTDAARGAA
jgi:chromosome partitioning protein